MKAKNKRITAMKGRVARPARQRRGAMVRIPPAVQAKTAPEPPANPAVSFEPSHTGGLRTACQDETGRRTPIPVRGAGVPRGAPIRVEPRVIKGPSRLRGGFFRWGDRPVALTEGRVFSLRRPAGRPYGERR